MMLIIVPPKRIDLLLRVLQRQEPMRVQAVRAKPTVERFDRGIVGRFATSAEVQNDPIRVGPEVHRRADELCPVVTIDALRQSSLEAQALERRGDIVAAESLADIDRQAFAREHVDHCQRAEAVPVRELVRDEVHAPNVVSCRRRSPLLAVDGGDMAPRSLASQRERLLGVDAVEALLADDPAFALHQYP